MKNLQWWQAFDKHLYWIWNLKGAVVPTLCKLLQSFYEFKHFVRVALGFDLTELAH